ncbi:hypothetical protein [Lentilitoribacter sp. Alg239-R112]|uniref:hypothetical protein n=1 Tax=Lentilitoribacter sp. Alg239-R112 TaxID=2305987 RepID=UPI0013A6CDB2|nr:hypothetical protein [Lentilitoribacter sp. Alg239-R112]
MSFKSSAVLLAATVFVAARFALVAEAFFLALVAFAGAAFELFATDFPVDVLLAALDLVAGDFALVPVDFFVAGVFVCVSLSAALLLPVDTNPAEAADTLSLEVLDAEDEPDLVSNAVLELLSLSGQPNDIFNILPTSTPITNATIINIAVKITIMMMLHPF